MTIERLAGLEEIVSSWVASKRTEILTNCANGADNDLAAEDRPDRELIAPRCRLKSNDHVLCNYELLRVVCPGRGVGWFYALRIDAGMFELGQHEAQYVEDRAPADPQEEPLPIFEPDPNEEPDPDPFPGGGP